MKYTTNESQLVEGARKYASVIYKRQFKTKNLISMILIVSLSVVCLLLSRLMVPEMKKVIDMFFILIGSAIIFVVLYITLICITYKKRKYNFKIVNVDFEFEEKLGVISNFKNGSINKVEYNYSDIKEIIDSKEFFYLILKNKIAYTLAKESVESKAEFVEFIKNRNIGIIEVK